MIFHLTQSAESDICSMLTVLLCLLISQWYAISSISRQWISQMRLCTQMLIWIYTVHTFHKEVILNVVLFHIIIIGRFCNYDQTAYERSWYGSMIYCLVLFWSSIIINNWSKESKDLIINMDFEYIDFPLVLFVEI